MLSLANSMCYWEFPSNVNIQGGMETQIQDNKPCEGKENATVFLEDRFLGILLLAGCLQNTGERLLD